MDNIGNGLIVVLASFLVGTFICGIAYLIEKILIWDLFLNEIPDGNKKVFADAIILLSGDNPDKYLFRLSKNKEGEIGDLPITFNKQIQRFQEYTWMD